MQETTSNNLTAAEIDARHVRQLLERALTRLEQGERTQAWQSWKQAVGLAPQAALVFSIGGLIDLLDGDARGAAAHYEKAATVTAESSIERRRLIVMQDALARGETLNFASLIPNLPAEIVRLRQAVQEAPPEDFIPNTLAPQEPKAAAHSPAIPPPATTPPPPLRTRASTQPVARVPLWMPVAYLAIVATFLGSLAYFALRKVPAPATQANIQTPAVTNPNFSALPAVTPTVPAPAIPAATPRQAQPGAAPSEPRSPAAPVTPGQPVAQSPRQTATPSGRTPAPPVIRRPATPHRDPANVIPVPEAPATRSQPEPTPAPTPRAPAEDSPGPRFSPPSSGKNDDDVGPRFSTP